MSKPADSQLFENAKLLFKAGDNLAARAILEKIEQPKRIREFKSLSNSVTVKLDRQALSAAKYWLKKNKPNAAQKCLANIRKPETLPTYDAVKLRSQQKLLTSSMKKNSEESLASNPIFPPKLKYKGSQAATKTKPTKPRAVILTRYAPDAPKSV